MFASGPDPPSNPVTMGERSVFCPPSKSVIDGAAAGAPGMAGSCAEGIPCPGFFICPAAADAIASMHMIKAPAGR